VLVTQEQPALLRIEQVTAILQIGRSHVYRLINAGRLKPVKLGKTVRISRGELERFVAALEEDSTDRAS
jgi:excisionase family DNA binding protein